MWLTDPPGEQAGTRKLMHTVMINCGKCHRRKKRQGCATDGDGGCAAMVKSGEASPKMFRFGRSQSCEGQGEASSSGGNQPVQRARDRKPPGMHVSCVMDEERGPRMSPLSGGRWEAGVGTSRPNGGPVGRLVWGWVLLTSVPHSACTREGTCSFLCVDECPSPLGWLEQGGTGARWWRG